jgi:hypothetical protein
MLNQVSRECRLEATQLTAIIHEINGICMYVCKYVRFEAFTAVAAKNVVFWDIKPNSYLTGDILRLRYTAQTVNTM